MYGVPYQQQGLVRIVSNAEMMADEEATRRKQEEDAREDTALLSGLSGYLKRVWESNQRAKIPIEAKMRKALRHRKGKYDAATMADLDKMGGSRAFIKLTNQVCRSAESWIKDIMLPAGERPWSAEATPIPEVPMEEKVRIASQVQRELQQALMLLGTLGNISPDQVAGRLKELDDKVRQAMQHTADEEAEEIEEYIEDELVEGAWYEALGDIIWDIVTFPACFIRGPDIEREKVLEWKEGKPVVVDKLKRKFHRISPFDAYPAANAKNVQEGPFVERQRLTRKQLLNMVGVPGFSETAIREALQQYGKSGLVNWLAGDQERAELENRPYEQHETEATIEVLRFDVSVQGQMLIDWGVANDPAGWPLGNIVATDEYTIQAWLCGPYTLGVKFNPHPLGKRNLFSASFDEVSDSIWGNGVPNLMDDIQDIANAIVRALVNNLGIASGPQVWMYADRLQAGAKIGKLWPWKIHAFHGRNITTNQPPMGWFQPDIHADVLLKVFQYFFDLASEITGIPRYLGGSQDTGRGAGKTATGLSLLMNAASKALKMVVKHIDDGIIKPSVIEVWLHIMLFDDLDYDGDVKIRARASDYLVMAEQLQIRLTELLAQTANPIDMDIIGEEGRADLLRENFRAHRIPVDVVPSIEDIKMRKQMEVRGVIEAIAGMLGVDPNKLAQMVGQYTQNPNNTRALQGGGSEKAPQVNPAGQKEGGKDFSMFNQRRGASA